MRMRFFLAVIFLATVHYSCFSQGDSLVVAEGKVFNAATKEPIIARITYQSLPYGNKVGVINNSTYSFPMFGEKYSITVEAQGYSTAKFMLDPAEANAEKKLVKDIELAGGVNKTHDHPVGHVMRLHNLIFEVGNAKIDPDSYGELDILVNMMQQNPKLVIQLEGHTDYIGNANDNLKLSQRRVDAAKDYLTSKGVAKNRVKTKAFGGSQPLSHDDTPEAHRLNRRVEVRILEN